MCMMSIIEIFALDEFYSNKSRKSFMPRSKKEGGYIALHMSVGRSVGLSVSLSLVQPITQERLAPDASNLVDTCI